MDLPLRLPTTAIALLICFPLLTYCDFPAVFDVVTLAYKPSCVNRQMVTKINKYLLPKPRKIHVIAGRSCDLYVQFADNVVCHQDDTLVPGMSYRNVYDWIRTRFEVNHTVEFLNYMLRRRAPWYFQQLLKLGSAAHLPELSEFYLILDSDMIILRPLSWFMPLEGKSVTLNPSPFPPARAVLPRNNRSCANPHPFRVLIQIGGWAPPYAYHWTYRYLTGKELFDGHSAQSLVPSYHGNSLVTHNILVYKPYMAEFLGNITKPQYERVQNGWALSIIDALATLPELTDLREGFSEYWSYLSWVQEHYPCVFMQAEKRTWTRIPLAYPGMMPKDGFVTAVPYGDSYVPVCCPTTEVLNLTAAEGYWYLGYELGHFDNCNFHHDAFHRGYAEWYLPLG